MQRLHQAETGEAAQLLRDILRANVRDRRDIDPIANPKAWIETGTLGSSMVRKLSPRSGERMLVHEGDAAYSVTTKQILEYIPNSLYRLSAWVKSSGGQALAEIRVSGHGRPGRVVPIPSAADWTELVIDNIKVTANIAVVSVVSQAGAGQWLHVDDLDFHNVGAAPAEVLVEVGLEMSTDGQTWLPADPGLYDSANGIPDFRVTITPVGQP